MSQPKPLAGVRVLDLTRLLPGPMCTLFLADLGADVVKVEDARLGDYGRTMAPIQKQQAYFFNIVNRNKRSLKLDYGTPEGLEVLQRLAQSADVFIESFRPGVAEKLGFGYEALKAVNERLVYCSLTGFGQTGPMRNVAGHDMNFAALAGVTDQTGANPDTPPAISNYQLGDLAGGALPAVVGILSALLRRGITNKGGFVDAAMFDGLLAQTVINASSLAAFGQSMPRGTDLLSGGMAFYGLYPTADRRYMAVGAIEFKFWQTLCQTIGREDLISRHIAVGEDAAAVRAELTETFMQHSQAYWTELLAGKDCCVTPVLTPEEAYSLPQTQARGLIQQHPHPTEGIVQHLASPFKMSEFEFEVLRHAPAWGEHSREVLAEAGFQTAEIEDLEKKSVIFQS
jgi:alpha-methylacyl-CoA racemase